MNIAGNIIGGILKNPDTIILVDEEGNEYPAYMTGEEVDLTATVQDIRLGKVAAIEGGAKVGEKVIPAYHTNEGVAAVLNGSSYTISALKIDDMYDYTKLQAIFCEFNTSLLDSVNTNMVSINGNVYATQSATPLAEVTKLFNDKTIDFGVTNNTGKTQLIRFFTYKEI